MILDGKKVAKTLYNELKENIQSLDIKPKLSVLLIGNNQASLRYIRQKEKWAKWVWMDFELFHFDENIEEQNIENIISQLNQDEKTSGFIIQLPLPKHFNEKKILSLIDPKKDVDGFHPVNQWKIVIWDETWLKACTPAGMMELLKYYEIDPKGKNIVIIGKSNIVGKPIANLLINAQATVTICNSQTKNIDFFTQNADIVITAMWVPKFLTPEKINKNTKVIDVGFSIIDDIIYGDADFENILRQWNDITPVPGGVGSLTVAMLLKNTFQAHQNTKKTFL